MQRLGFIHDMKDVRVLILFVTARAHYPMTSQEIYEQCYQDDCLSYFDVCTAIPEMVQSGHLRELEEQRYEITEKGREDGALLENDIAYTVRRRAEDAVDRFNRRLRRNAHIKTQVIARADGEFSVSLSLDDEKSNLMTLELLAPNQRQAVRLQQLLEEKAEELYNLTMAELLDEEDELEN